MTSFRSPAAALVLLMALGAWASSCGSDRVSEETRLTLVVRQDNGELVWADRWYKVPTEPYGVVALDEEGVIELVVRDADKESISICIPFMLITVVYIRGELSSINVGVVEGSLTSHIKLAETIAIAMGSDANHLRTWAKDPSQGFGRYGHRLVSGPVSVHVDIRESATPSTWYMDISFYEQPYGPSSDHGDDRREGDG